MDTSVSIRRQNYWGPSWDWLLEPDTVRFLIFVFLVSVSPLIFPLICIPSLHFTHSLNFSSLDSFIPQQFLIPYFILTQWVTGDTEASHVCFLTFQSSSLEQEHSMVFLSLLKATPNISRTWFRPQDFSETCFSTLIHHQTTNLTPKALMYSRCCWSFQVETKDGIISFECMCDKLLQFSSVQFSSVAQSCPTLCNPMNRSTPGLPVHHQFPEFTQTHVHRVSDATQPSYPLSSPPPLAPNPSQHQSLFQWVNSSHEVAKVLEFQL